MRRLHHLFILITVTAINSCNQGQKKVDINVSWKKIPSDWIVRAQRFPYESQDTKLLKDFKQIIQPDTSFNLPDTSGGQSYRMIFSSVSVDLDGDGQSELLSLQGWNEYAPFLCVFKQIGQNWYLIYSEEIDTFYGTPTIYIANNYSNNKTFYLRRVYDHGSGIYIDGYTFYKLIDNNVYKSLRIINDSHIDGWGLYLNESVQSTFDFRGDADDVVSVRYSYNFFPGSIYKTDCSWCSHDDIPLIKGEQIVDYEYDKKNHQYRPDFPRYQNSAFDLTADKISRFGDFGNDSLFVKAFKRDIDTTLKLGTPLQKKVLRQYLSILKKDKEARTQQLKVTKQAGKTIFYGIKK